MTAALLEHAAQLLRQLSRLADHTTEHEAEREAARLEAEARALRNPEKPRPARRVAEWRGHE